MLLKNKTFGSALIIAGTAIGAGMLAMPLTSAGMGFAFTAALLIGLWLLLAYSGLLFVEVYQTAKRKDDGVATLAEKYFGIPGRIISTLSLFILLYALSAAYMAGGGTLLANALPKDFLGSADITLKISILIFTFILGAFVVIGTKGVDNITRVLFSGKIIAFILVLAIMLPKVIGENLTAMPLEYTLILSAGPIFFTSFGFHVVMGSINNYLEGDVKRFRSAIIIGTAIPLMAYLLWQLATHGILSQNEFVAVLKDDPTLSGLINATKTLRDTTLLSQVLPIFYSFALITSFLGVALGLFEGLNDLFKRTKMPANRVSLTIATFTPPLIFALFYPNGFLSALSYAGLLCAFYCLILPIGLAWRTRKQYQDLPYRVAGGNLMLVVTLIIGIIIIIIPFLTEAGILPRVVS
ncbi:aromatic amino acid transport family protein [Aggregatibacter actinomycetemcomitans]|uniref:aromatic amino acid transport family protein n=1 Tax=Aggregatibacter actinomycetemcomitans TaxID=714 RepID=UPI0001B9F1BA|nr:aromatic amino acid transport family protein [Aggregatibacter actinomycetemcomitans]ACX81984.1 tyrosine transporter [Aggregatibacter actinomycetemcomitans D11S-1]AHN71653.1 tyrosine-specific transport protein, putative [Aggregatibacter actinomycetemcomitans HK1651]AMQ92528.1 tyrosine transporter [Aggregatibacter actinomycetemcomitans]KOE53178.1 tyrosine transporter [Aggregatibacter actinomycetemcomitans serotype b str. S23A]KOE58324.1 tyrosine transporter [Aggregatibacter actinomycetemcomit